MERSISCDGGGTSSSMMQQSMPDTIFESTPSASDSSTIMVPGGLSAVKAEPVDHHRDDFR